MLKGKFYLCGTNNPNLLPGLRQDDIRIYDLALQQWKCVITQVKPKGCQHPFIEGYQDQLIQFGGVCHEHDFPKANMQVSTKAEKRYWYTCMHRLSTASSHFRSAGHSAAQVEVQMASSSRSCLHPGLRSTQLTVLCVRCAHACRPRALSTQQSVVVIVCLCMRIPSCFTLSRAMQGMIEGIDV